MYQACLGVGYGVLSVGVAVCCGSFTVSPRRAVGGRPQVIFDFDVCFSQAYDAGKEPVCEGDSNPVNRSGKLLSYFGYVRKGRDGSDKQTVPE
jgi:hypothetical protein